MSSPFHQAVQNQASKSPFHAAVKEKKPYQVLPGEKERIATEQAAVRRLNKGGSFGQNLADIFAIGDDDVMPPAMAPEPTKELGKSALSGATIGLSENVPGLVPDRENYGALTTVGQVAGSLAPFSGFLKLGGAAAKPLVNLAAKSPIMGRQLGSLANLMGVAGAGAAYKGAEEAFQGKMPSVDDMVNEGMLWGALDAGLNAAGTLGQFTANLIRKAKGEAKPTWDVLNDVFNQMRKEGIDVAQPDRVAAKAMSILEKDAPKATAKPFKAKAEPSFEGFRETPRPKGEAPIEPFQTSAIDERVSKYAPRYADKKAFGEGVQAAIKEEQDAARKVYQPLYEKVKPIASGIRYNAENSAKYAMETVEKLQSLQTRPPGYEQAITKLSTALEDMGFIIQKEEGLIKAIGFDAKRGSQTLDKLIDLSRRISELADYETLEPTIKKYYGKLAKQLKEDAKQGLMKANPNAYKDFEAAERTYEDFARKLNRESIQNIRYKQDTESVADLIKKPTALADLKNTLSPQRFKEVERELLEHFNELTPKEGRKLLRETQNYMSEDGAKLAREVIEQKEFNQFVSDLISKDGTIDFAKASAAMSNPETRAVIENIGGKEAVQFFKNLKKLDAEIKANTAKMLEQQAMREPLERISTRFKDGKPIKAERGEQILKKASRARHPLKAKFNDLAETLGESEKTVFGVLMGMALGTKKALGVMGLRLLYNMAQKPSVRKRFMELMNASRRSPLALITAVENLSDELD